LFDSLLAVLNAETRLCIATDISLETEFIKTRTLKQWKLHKPELNKRPTIFLFHAK
jgi:16S rRNA (cytidine1402-2'-O)-methyltransferase